MTPELAATKTQPRGIRAHPAWSALGPILIAIAALLQMRQLAGFTGPRASEYWDLRMYTAWLPDRSLGPLRGRAGTSSSM